MAGTTVSRGPLDGLLVVDAGTILATPMVGGLLGDFGATVIKVEDALLGDPIRQYPPNVNGQALGSKVTNRNKAGIAIDLRQDSGRELLRAFVSKSDVFLTNFRPETLARWQLDYADLEKKNPAMVMLHLSGFGRTGPFRNRPGFARVAEAFGGLTHITGLPDGPPIFSGYPVADGLAGVYGAFSVMLALFERQNSGRGQLIDLALYEPIMRMMEDMLITFDVSGTVKQRNGNINPYVSPNDLYTTSDGSWVTVPASTQNMFVRLCSVLDREDLAQDERFRSNTLRVENRAALDNQLRPEISRLSPGELLAKCESAGVAAGVVNTAREVFQDAHCWERNSIVRVWDVNLGRDIAMPGVFPKLSRTPGSIRSPGPELGQDTSDVLQSVLNLSRAEIEDLRQANVIR